MEQENFFQQKKCGVMFYHKNIYSLYKQAWIDKCIESILHQKIIVFDIFELNYENQDISIFQNRILADDKKLFFFHQNMDTHTEAMIFLLNQGFESGYDIMYNTNLDDYYDKNRFYYQYIDIIQNHSTMNSCLYTTIKNDTPVLSLCYENNEFIWKPYSLNNFRSNEIINYDIIRKNLNENKNVICHPGVCFTKQFWSSFDKNGNLLRYRNDMPFEDLSLWIRAINNDIRITILNLNLVWYRQHEKNISSTARKIKKKPSLIKNFRHFKTKPDLSAFRVGFFIHIQNNDFSSLCKIEDSIFHIEKFYFIIIPQKYLNNLYLKLEDKNIKNYHIVTSNENISFQFVKSNHRSTVEMNSDFFFDVNEIHWDYVFYTFMYHNPKSPLNLENVKNLLELIKNYKLFIFVNQLTLNILETHFCFCEFSNIIIIQKEMSDMEYECNIVYMKNTNNFPTREIDYNMIKIWINRHLLVKEVQKKIYSRFYCHIDVDYIQEFVKNESTFECYMLKDDKIYFGLTNYSKTLITYLKQIMKDFEKDTTKIIHEEHVCNIKGGFSIIPFSKVHYWIQVFKSTFNTYLENKIEFKDDSAIISQIIINDKNYKENFRLLSTHTNFFPFRHFLEDNKSVKILHEI